MTNLSLRSALTFKVILVKYNFLLNKIALKE